jgi:3',5'-cyclic AMP phosphodiesterase CpdA
MTRIFQLSDTHLSRRTPRFRRNYELVVRHARSANYDVIVHTGDLTLDGIRHEDDLYHCRDALGELGAPVLCVPGNHDVGNHPKIAKGGSTGNGSGISEERLARSRAVVGADYWLRDVPGWRLLGLDSMLCGSGLRAEEEQYRWLDEALDTAGERRLALFIHQPVFIDDPAENTLTYWCVDPAVRGRLGALVEHPNLRLIASGHLHTRRSARHGRIALEWCSSTAFVAGPALVPEMGGERHVGCVEHVLHVDHVESRTVQPAGMENPFIDDFIDEVYPLD